MSDVVISVVTKQAEGYTESMQSMITAQLQRLVELGAKVIQREDVPQRFVVLDQRVVWFGSICPLGYSNKNDSIIRVEDVGLAAALLDRMTL